MPAVNKLLQNRYRIVRQLGRGGMGAVYEATDERFGTPIALKEIFIDAVSEKQKSIVLEAFEREAKSLAKIRHETVPFVRDYFSEFDRQFLVMELVEGDDLAHQMEKRQTPFPIETGLSWLEQLLDTLEYLHSLSPPIIHRDIKPQNLKLTARHKIKLLDFGIVKNSDAASTKSSQTFMGATLDYSPIEQILRVIDPTYREFILLKYRAEAEAILAQNTDGRSDIYSLGATFYHLLTGEQPVDSPKRALELWSGNGDPLVNPSVLNPNIPPKISECLLKAMETDRENRFSTATEMQSALKNARTDKTHLIAVNNTQTEEITAERKIPRNYENSFPQTTIAFEPKIQTVRQPNDKSFLANKALWTIPAIALIVLTTVAVAAWVLINPPKSSQSADEPLSNAVPTVSTTVVPTTPASPSPIVAPNLTPNQSPEKNVQSSKPSAEAPKNNETVKPTATKKPVQAPPKPKPTEDPNCVFTNNCRN